MSLKRAYDNMRCACFHLAFFTGGLLGITMGMKWGCFLMGFAGCSIVALCTSEGKEFKPEKDDTPLHVTYEVLDPYEDIRL